MISARTLLLAGLVAPITAAHRTTERDDLPDIAHAHLDRRDTAAMAAMLAETGAETRMDDYENLDVEEVALHRGATVLRLPLVYGERDPIRREEFILAHVRAGHTRIEIGVGTLLWTKAWVRDVARAVRLAAESGTGTGTPLNIGERRTLPMIGWARAILDAAGHDAELVVVPDGQLSEPMAMTGGRSQHLLVDSTKARQLLGWEGTAPPVAIRASVRWHLEHPPES